MPCATVPHFNSVKLSSCRFWWNITKITSWRCLTCWPVKLWRCKMMSLVNKSGDWTPNYHKILIFSPPKSLKSLRAARIDELADSNEPAKIFARELHWAQRPLPVWETLDLFTDDPRFRNTNIGRPSAASKVQKCDARWVHIVEDVHITQIRLE